MGSPAVRAAAITPEQRYQEGVAAVRRNDLKQALSIFEEIRAADAAPDDRFVRTPLGRRAGMNVAILNIATSGIELQDPSFPRPPQQRFTSATAAREKLDKAEAALRAAT